VKGLALLVCSLLLMQAPLQAEERQRPRALGIVTGILAPGPLNAITDVDGVRVGHFTLERDRDVHTGITVVMPHAGDLYRQRPPAAVYVGNGYGKALGFTQVQELGELETPIALTNTLSIHSVANGVADYMLSLPGNGDIRSINPVVGETNDGYLNDIRARLLRPEHVIEAIEAASGGPVAEGNVGAGTGTSALGYKGGIGSASRVLPEQYGAYTVGVLVQSNFGGILSVDGVAVGEALNNHYLAGEVPYDVDGSCMIIVATDAPLSDRNLERLAKRAFLGIARVGGFASNGSGDYVIAFSNNQRVLRRRGEATTQTVDALANDAMTPLFLAAVEATEEAILNSLFMAEDMRGHRGERKALPVDEVIDLFEGR
jgi:D-aminopeptidase